MITEQQKRVIRENPHLQAGKLANLLGLNVDQVSKQKMTEQHKRVIRENPHLQSGKLAKFLGISVNTLTSYRKRNLKRTWSYTGVSIPFLRYDKHIGYRVKYKKIHLYGGSFDGAINWQGQLLWLLERGLCPFGLDNKPIFLQNLKFGE